LASGLLNERVMHIALLILPAFLIAIVLGSFVHTKIKESAYQYCVQIILMIAGISLLLTH